MSFRDKFQSKQFDQLGPRKTFDHHLVKLPKLERIDAEDGRRYVTPEGNAYPSVTTVLGATEDKGWLDDWKDRIGEKEANKITSQSARRGTKLHDMCERYVLNEEDYLRDPTPVYYDLFRQIKPMLDKSIGKVYGTELGLYSNILKIAGTTDLAADYEDVPSIVDYKNARRVKTQADVHGYYLQTSIYSWMLEERTGLKVPQIVILMAVEGQKEGIVFKRRRSDFNKEIADTISSYYKTHK